MLNNNKRRIQRVRAKISGTAERPRLAVFRSNCAIYGQLINDEIGKTLAAASSTEIKTEAKPVELAREVGKLLAKKAKEAKITSAVFDRRSYQYHGRVQALAEGARDGGLII